MKGLKMINNTQIQGRWMKNKMRMIKIQSGVVRESLGLRGMIG